MVTEDVILDLMPSARTPPECRFGVTAARQDARYNEYGNEAQEAGAIPDRRYPCVS
jgi:hypothetical protein